MHYSEQPSKSLTGTVLDLVNVVVELYLGSVIRPFVAFHQVFYGSVWKKILEQLVRDNKSSIPVWFTANFVIYARAASVLPTLFLLSRGHVLLPAILALLIDVGSFLDSVVARFWEDVQKEARERKEKEGDVDDDKKTSPPTSPTNLDQDSFEVVTTGSPQPVPSWITLEHTRTHGAFVNALSEKAFAISCWVSLLPIIPNSGYLRLLQYFSFFSLIVFETASSFLGFKAHFGAGGAVPPPKFVSDDDDDDDDDSDKLFSGNNNAVSAKHIANSKQTFEMVGTALYMIPLTRYIGVVLLVAAVPLAYESVRRTVQPRVVYVHYGGSSGGDDDSEERAPLDHNVLRFWMQIKALGCTKLIVGVPGTTGNGKQQQQATTTKNDRVLNACACTAVDLVIAGAPAKADLMFLERLGIDYCAIQSQNKSKLVTDEVINAERCLEVSQAGAVKLVTIPTGDKEQ